MVIPTGSHLLNFLRVNLFSCSCFCSDLNDSMGWSSFPGFSSGSILGFIPVLSIFKH
jgi:hypothetical protein